MSGLHDMVYPERAIAVSDIVSIGPAAPGGHATSVRRVTLRGADAFSLGVVEIEDLLQRPVQLIPCEPGTYVLRTWTGQASQEVGKTAVIAWALCLDGGVRPVTPQGVSDGVVRFADQWVLMPDKSVQAIGQHTEPVWFDSIEDFHAHHAEDGAGR